MKPILHYARKCSAAWKLGPGEIRSQSRMAHIVEARQVAFHLAIRAGHTPWSVEIFFGRCKGVATHCVNRVRDRMENEHKFRAKVEALEKTL